MLAFVRYAFRFTGKGNTQADDADVNVYPGSLAAIFIGKEYVA
jgi:hypothetical protein